jgi:hypothetical protein
VHVLLLVERRIPLHRVLELERLRPDQHPTHGAELPEFPDIEALTQRDGPAKVLVQPIVRGAGEIVVDLVVDQLALGHPARGSRSGRADGQTLQPFVVGVVGPQVIGKAEPRSGGPVGVYVPEDPAGLGPVHILKQHPERVGEETVPEEVARRRALVDVRAVESAHRIEVLAVVEVGRGAQQPELQAVGVVAPLHVVSPAVGVGDVRPQLEVLGHAMGAVQPDRNALVVIIGTGEDAVVPEILTGQVEKGAVGAAGDRQVVIGGEAGPVSLIGVIEDRLAGDGQVGAPAPEAGPAGVELGAPQRRRHTAQTLAEPGLEWVFAGYVIDAHRTAQGVPSGARGSLLGGDQHDALSGPGAVDGCGGRALQDLDRLDIVGVHVSRPIGLGGALDLARSKPLDQVEIGGGEAGVVDRHPIHHEERLRLSGPGQADGALPPDRHIRRGARLAARLGDVDVGCLGRERLHYVGLIGALDLLAGNVVPHCPELLGLGDGARPGDDDFAELQRIGLQGEVLVDRPFAQRDLHRLGLVADSARGKRNGLSLDPGGRDQDRVLPVCPGGRPQPEGWDRYRGSGERLSRVVVDLAGYRDRLLRSEYGGKNREGSKN